VLRTNVDLERARRVQAAQAVKAGELGPSRPSAGGLS
jgi:hypothetical protein